MVCWFGSLVVVIVLGVMGYLVGSFSVVFLGLVVVWLLFWVGWIVLGNGWWSGNVVFMVLVVLCVWLFWWDYVCLVCLFVWVIVCVFVSSLVFFCVGILCWCLFVGWVLVSCGCVVFVRLFRGWVMVWIVGWLGIRCLLLLVVGVIIVIGVGLCWYIF